MEHAFEVPSGAVDGRVAVEVVLSHSERERTCGPHEPWRREQDTCVDVP